MLFASLSPLLLAAWTVSASPAPVPAPVPVLSPVPAWVETHQDGLSTLPARSANLEKRISTEFSLARQWDNEVLFGGNWVDTGSSDSESVSLELTCVECWTSGTVTAKLTTEDVFKPVVRLEFDEVEAYIDLDLKTSASATYAVTLFSTESPIGIGLPDLDVGIVFSLDLVFSVSALVDLQGGFYVKLANDAYLDTDLFGGAIADSFFDGIQTQSIPVTVFNGDAVFKADLRLRVQCGAEASLDIFGIGAGAEIGIYANLLEFVSELDSSASCGLETREWFDLNVGAFAILDVEVDYKTFGAVPTVSTTLFDSPTFTQCWDGSLPSASASGAIVTMTSGGSVPVGTASMASETMISVSATPSMISPGTTAATTSAHGSPAVTSTVPGVQAVSSFTSLSRPTPGSSGAHHSFANSSVSLPASDLVTSTVYSTTVYTVTSCAASVVNCPASLGKEVIVTRTIDSYTTVCPLGASLTAAASTQASAAQLPTPSVTAVHIVTSLVTIPKISPKVQTFVQPTTIKPVNQQTVTAAASQPARPAPASSSNVQPGAHDEYKAPSSIINQAATQMAKGTGSIGTASFTAAVEATSAPFQAGSSGMSRFLGSEKLLACAVLAMVMVM